MAPRPLRCRCPYMEVATWPGVRCGEGRGRGGAEEGRGAGPEGGGRQRGGARGRGDCREGPLKPGASLAGGASHIFLPTLVRFPPTSSDWPSLGLSGPRARGKVCAFFLLPKATVAALSALSHR